MTFARACSHLSNFTSGHESRVRFTGDARLDFPTNHIEVDNRLTWFLGALDARFGQDAYYVHLIRDAERVAHSLIQRKNLTRSIVKAWQIGVLQGGARTTILDAARDYVRNANDNIAYFLRDKPHKMTARLETLADDMPRFFEWIGGEGNLAAAISETRQRHNATPPLITRRLYSVRRAAGGILRALHLRSQNRAT